MRHFIRFLSLFSIAIILSACKVNDSSDKSSDAPVTPVAKKYYAYAGAQYSNVIYGFKIDKDTGAVSDLPFGSIASGAMPMITVASTDKKFLLAADYSGDSVSSFQINQSTGELTLVEHEDLSAGSSPAWIVANPNVNVYYTANSGQASISILDGASDGSLSVRTTAAADSGVTCLAINKAGTVLYALNQNAETISIYSVAAGDGSLSFVSDVSTGSGSLPNQISLTSDGRFLYVANWGGQSVEGFSVSGTTLTSLGAPVSAGAGVYMVTPSPDGTRLFASQPYNGGFKEFPLDTSTGAISAAISHTWTGNVSMNFVNDFALLIGWTGNVAGLAIDTRTYSSASGLGASSVSQTSSGYRGLYQMTVIELDDL